MGEPSSPGSTLCAESYFGIRSAPVLLQDPGHSAKSAGGGLQLNTHAPYVCGFAWSGMDVWCTQDLRWDGCSFMWHHFDGYSPPPQFFYFIKLVTHVEPHASAVSLLNRAENSTI